MTNEPRKQGRRSGPISARRVAASAALAAGLVAGGVGIASAATTTTSPHASSSWAPRDGQGPAGGGGPGMPGGPGGPGGPHGTVTAVSADSITISGMGGRSLTFAIDSSTIVTKDGSAASASDLAVGERVDVIAPMPSSSSSAATQTATSIRIDSPREGGTVVSVSSSGFVIQDDQGFWHTVATSSTTTYTKAGSAAAASDVAVGEFVSASGPIASDHTTLEATQVMIGQPAPGQP